MDWSLGNYWYLLLLLVIPVLGIMMMNYIRWRNARKNIFAEERFHSELFEKSKKISKILPLLYLLAFTFLIFSIVDLLLGKEQMKTQQKMNNVLFVLDVSNSMNAEDVEPSRLILAKNIILQTVKNLKNDRVGMVVFAGNARSIMPLTTDYSVVETYIGGIETSIIQKQGTDFLLALQEAEKKFKTIPKNARQIVLISDGEDNEENEKKALELAQKEGIRITTVGVGTEEGTPIPEYIYGQLMGYKMNYNGETVISKLQTDALKKLANGTKGNYIKGDNIKNASAEIVKSINAQMGSTEVTVDSQNAIHYYQYFLAVSLFLFLIIFIFNPKKDFNI